MIIAVKTQDACLRIAKVLTDIVGWKEWEHQAQSAAFKNWSEARETLRHFFDAYEGSGGEDWLGVLEWAVIEEVLVRGRNLEANQDCIDNILARLSNHPNIKMSDW